MSAFATLLSPTAEAKLRRTEVPLLRELLTEIFGRTPSSASLTCVSNRLQAGTIDELLIDGLLASDDVTQLSNSIPFRRVFRQTFTCQPREMIASLSASFASTGLNFSQRNCMARNFSKQIGTNDPLLTIIIFAGVNDLDFETLAPEDKVILAASFAGALRTCLPRSLANDAIDELIDELLGLM